MAVLRVDDPALDGGVAGHCTNTQLPFPEGNFGIAAHRDGHGEPFRRLGLPQPGGQVLLRTPQALYTCTPDRELSESGAEHHGALDSSVPASP